MNKLSMIKNLSSLIFITCSFSVFAGNDLPPVKAYIDLNHALEDHMTTYPGLSEVSVFHKAARFDNGALIDGITFLGISSTYIDAPYHADAHGKKIADYTLDQLANLPIVVVKLPAGQTVFDTDLFKDIDVTGKAVLLNTGRDRYFGTKEYSKNPPYLSTAAAQWLVAHKAKLVGIDALLVDDFTHSESIPVHDILLKNNVVIAEDMANISAVEGKNAYLTAVPPRAPMASFPTRIFATVY